MRFWLSKSSEVPLREQLTTQVLLGIFSNDLKPGQKLPSTREMALRFRIHPNTVSAAYRDLASRGWVEFRKGSGVYIQRAPENASIDADMQLDHLISTFFQAALEKGFPLREVQSRLKQWLELQPPDHFLVIEPDAELCRVLVAEIKEAIRFPVMGAQPDDGCQASLAGAVPVFMFNREEQIRKILPPRMPCLLLHARSVPATLAEKIPISPNALIAVASRWPDFLRWARAVLVAAGVSPDALLFCDAREARWERGLQEATAVVTDIVTAKAVPSGCRQYVFNLIADESLDELRRFIECLEPEKRDELID